MEAPVVPGQKAGVLEYRLGGKRTSGQVDVITKECVEKAGYKDYLRQLLQTMAHVAGSLF